MDNPLSNLLNRQHEMMIDWINDYLNSLNDEDLKTEVAPGKNHGVWILVHMISSEDDLSLFLGKGEVMFPEYQELYSTRCKLRLVEDCPEITKLREDWKKVIEKTREIYSNLKDEELPRPHALVENYDKDYFKTKERVLMAWQFHQLYHVGQLGLIASILGKPKY